MKNIFKYTLIGIILALFVFSAGSAKGSGNILENPSVLPNVPKAFVPPMPGDDSVDGSIKPVYEEEIPLQLFSEAQSAPSQEQLLRLNDGDAEKILVIPVQFTDIQFSENTDIPAVMDKMRLYYEHNSNYSQGQSGMTIDYTITPIVTLPSPMTYYGADGAGIDDANTPIYNLTKAAILSLDPIFNFTPFDDDSDGVIDHVLIVHAGRGQEEAADPAHDIYADSLYIWSHRWAIYGEAVYVAVVRAFNYT